MSLNISRREFIKNSTIAAAGVSVAPISSFAASKGKKQDKSRVVIATDTECVSGSAFDEERIQEMVDHAIIYLTGVNNKAKAYEALFPEPVTDSTTIAIKKNSVSAGKKNKSWPYVRDALVKGLTYMREGTFPEGNINVTTGGSSSSTNPKFDVGNKEYTIKDPWVQSDYIINCPVCWAHGSGHGVTLALKNMMSAVKGGSGLSPLHKYATSSSEPWMSILSSQPTFKNKQVLVLTDAITGRAKGGPGGNADFEGYCVLASQDMVACDYQGMLILIDNDLSSSREQTARKVLELAALPDYALGTDDPDEMEVLEKSPPWEDVTDINKKAMMRKNNIHVRVSTHATGSRVTFIVPVLKGRTTDLSIFDMGGKKIWAHQQVGNRFVWKGTDFNGKQVSTGMYVYSLKVGKQAFNGKFRIKR